jgi:hypothetical protein
MSVIWFCGRHVDASESGGYVGGRAMLASFIDQLLRQYEFDMRPLHHDVDLASLHGGDLDMLTKLLGWLVRQLPESTTVFFLVDGVALFERDEFEGEALPVLSSLLSLVGDKSVTTTVKLLFASTPATDIVRGAFEAEDLILDVQALPILTRPMSDERFGRELMYSEE